MTVSPPPARGLARVGDGGPRAGADQAVLLPRRRLGHLGPVHVTQLLLAELVIIGVLAALNQGALVVTGAALAGLLLLGITMGRQQGRWWLERRLIVRQFRRRLAGGADRAADPRLTALRRLAPGLVVSDVDVADGAQVGVARDDAGWYAVIAVPPTAAGFGEAGPGLGEAGPGLPLDAMVAALGEAEQAGATLQVVTHTIPAPSLDTPAQSLAGQSYRQLLAGFGAVPVPVSQTSWVAVRLDARTLAELGVDDDADLGSAPAVVAALVRRVGTSLRRAGTAHQVLDSEGLLAALARSCDLESLPTTGGGPPVVREDWSAWHSTRLAHRAFWVRSWPPLGQAAHLLRWLATAPAAVSSLALVLAPDQDQPTVDLRCLLRVAAPAGELAAVCETIAAGARRAGAELFPLDGEQGPAVYASAPTGGGPR
jgi:type VII secretion protein EccE